VDDRHHIVATGYNGAGTSEPHCVDVGCQIFGDHCMRAIHAEQNALNSAWQVFARMSPVSAAALATRKRFLAPLSITAYIYAPLAPCTACCRAMYEAGIKTLDWEKG